MSLLDRLIDRIADRVAERLSARAPQFTAAPILKLHSGAIEDLRRFERELGRGVAREMAVAARKLDRHKN